MRRAVSCDSAPFMRTVRCLTVANTLFAEPYLSTDPKHQGLLLHSVYHRPNGWDYIPKGRKVPCGESSMWGDYHAMELALLISRMAAGKSREMYFVLPSATVSMNWLMCERLFESYPADASGWLLATGFGGSQSMFVARGSLVHGGLQGLAGLTVL